MGWHDQHLFEFHTGQGRFGTRHDAFQDAGNPVRPGRSALLKNAISPQTRHLHYIYDMGDYWEHQIVLEEVLSNDTREPILQCVGGANQCPPEDIGGAGGYKIFLEAITDPSHEEHEYYVDVYGEGFDPGHFDLNEVNKRLCRTKRKLLRLQARAHDQSDIR